MGPSDEASLDVVSKSIVFTPITKCRGHDASDKISAVGSLHTLPEC